MLENPFYYNEESKEERGFLRKVIAILGAVCFVVLLIAGVLYATPIRAVEIPVHVFEERGLTLRLMPGPCVDGASSFILNSNLPTHAAKAREIESFWPMQDGTRKKYVGCWLELKKADIAGLEDDVFVLVFEDASHFIVRRSDIVKAKPSV